MIRFLFILSLVSASLFARLNPFEPVDGQSMEEVGPRTVTNVNSKDDGNRTVKIISDKKDEMKKEPKKIVQKETKNELTKELKRVETSETKVSAKEKVIDTVAQEAPKKVVEAALNQVSGNNSKAVHIEPKKVKKSVTKKNNKKVLKSKKYSKKKILKSKVASSKMAQKKSTKAIKYNILPLVTIDLLDKNLTIKTTSNHKLIKYYEEKSENKFVFDFQANVAVPTANENLSSQYYQSYIVGNHPEENFFRVVIRTKDDVSNYKVMIQNNIGTIIHK